MKITLIIIIVLICVIVILIRNSQIQGELHEEELEAAKKSVRKNNKYESKLQNDNTEVGKAFNDLNQTTINNMVKLKKSLKKLDMDTSEIDDYLKKYANKK